MSQRLWLESGLWEVGRKRKTKSPLTAHVTWARADESVGNAENGLMGIRVYRAHSNKRKWTSGASHCKTRDPNHFFAESRFGPVMQVLAYFRGIRFQWQLSFPSLCSAILVCFVCGLLTGQYESLAVSILHFCVMPFALLVLISSHVWIARNLPTERFK